MGAGIIIPAFTRSSSIQTILSALEFHQISVLTLVGFTTGGESHPALKILIQLRKVYAGDTGLTIPFPKKAWKIQGLEGPRSTMAYEAPCGLH